MRFSHRAFFIVFLIHFYILSIKLTACKNISERYSNFIFEYRKCVLENNNNTHLVFLNKNDTRIYCVSFFLLFFLLKSLQKP